MISIICHTLAQNSHLIWKWHYSKICVKWPLSKDQKLVFKTNYRLMQVESIAECSKMSILQYFWPSWSYQLLLRSLLCLFLSGRFTQILLYHNSIFFFRTILLHIWNAKGILFEHISRPVRSTMSQEYWWSGVVYTSKAYLWWACWSSRTVFSVSLVGENGGGFNI